MNGPETNSGTADLDVLGEPYPAEVPKKYRRHWNALQILEKQKLAAELEEGDSGESLMNSPDDIDRANALHESAVDAALENSGETLPTVQAAISRLQTGTYGKCCQCTKVIPAERLFARLTTETCIRCQRALETNR
jgi:DnaK suppressor protein